MSSPAEKYTDYFQTLIDELREEHGFTKARLPGKGKPYYAFASGMTYFKYIAGFIVDPVITYTFASLCELVNLRLMEAQANSLCYKCKHIFGFYYNRDGEAFTALGIYFTDREKNKSVFDALKERKSEINTKFDTLIWRRADDISRCAIGLWREGNIESDAWALEALKSWHIQNLLKLKEVFTPEIQRVLDRLGSS